MRNQGPPRNVVYNYEALTDPSAGPTDRLGEDDVASALRSRRSQIQPNHAPFFSSNVEKDLIAKEAVLRRRNGFGFSYDMQERSGGELGVSDPYSEFYTVVLANDYTKNISEPIHSSGLIDDSGAGPRKLQQYGQSRRGSNMPQKANSKMMK